MRLRWRWNDKCPVPNRTLVSVLAQVIGLSANSKLTPCCGTVTALPRTECPVTFHGIQLGQPSRRSLAGAAFCSFGGTENYEGWIGFDCRSSGSRADPRGRVCQPEIDPALIKLTCAPHRTGLRTPRPPGADRPHAIGAKTQWPAGADPRRKLLLPETDPGQDACGGGDERRRRGAGLNREIGRAHV